MESEKTIATDQNLSTPSSEVAGPATPGKGVAAAGKGAGKGAAVTRAEVPHDSSASAFPVTKDAVEETQPYDDLNDDDIYAEAYAGSEEDQDVEYGVAEVFDEGTWSDDGDDREDEDDARSANIDADDEQQQEEFMPDCWEPGGEGLVDDQDSGDETGSPIAPDPTFDGYFINSQTQVCHYAQECDDALYWDGRDIICGMGAYRPKCGRGIQDGKFCSDPPKNKVGCKVCQR